MIFSWSSFVVGFTCGTFFAGFIITSTIIIYSYNQYQNIQRANSDAARKIQDSILGAAREAFNKGKQRQ